MSAGWGSRRGRYECGRNLRLLRGCRTREEHRRDQQDQEMDPCREDCSRCRNARSHESTRSYEARHHLPKMSGGTGGPATRRDVGA